MRALAAGVTTRGCLTKSDLVTVVDWKSPRSRRHIARVPEELIVEATTAALAATNEELRIGTLTLIPGVGYPTASVLLHFFDPEPYPIIDLCAMWALGLDKAPRYYTFDAWWAYVRACRHVAAAADADMRTLDRALWQYSKENQQV